MKAPDRITVFKSLSAMILGVASFVLLVYFYMAQRNFEYNFKEIRAKFHVIDRSYHLLNYEILRTSLFAYTDQDRIVQEMERIKKEYQDLKKHPLWRKKHFRKTARLTESFGEMLKVYERNIEDFLMQNAGIKNSFVFIVSLPSKNIKLLERYPRLHIRILSVVTEISQARLLADASYLQDLKKNLDVIEQDTKGLSGDDVRFFSSFMIHARFIQHHYPAFIKTVGEIESSGLDSQLEKMENSFLEAAKTDFIMLDRFAVFLLMLFIVAMVIIIWLLLRTGSENRKLRQLDRDLRHSLSHDQLTGLLSRNRFEKMQKAFEKPTLLLLNIDNFKHINDFYGIKTGNAILKEVAILIRQPVLEPYHPSFFRLGGDDFGIVLQNVDTERARQMGTMIKHSIESYAFPIDGIETYITISVAANCLPPLLENADLVLKYEKKRHSGSVLFFSEAMHLKEQARNNLAITHRVKSALDGDRIEPWFQPIVSMADGTIVKYEALVRLRNDDGRVESPESFLPVAVQTPYYRKITQVMLQKVMQTMAQSELRFSINLSMRDLVDEKMVSMLLTQLEQNREVASRMDIELLESEELDDLDAVRSFIIQVKAYGCLVAIDDFGSGYSNFAYIIDLPIDILKIDGSLISKMREDSHKQQAVKNIADFAHTLGLNTVAEFVEDEATAEILREMNVTMGQGYYFGKPARNIIS